MADHITQHHLELYLQQRLSPPELLRLDDHLIECERCRQQLSISRPMDEVVRTLRINLEIIPLAVSDHLIEENLKAYANGNLDQIERELVESHLEFCEQCSTQVRASVDRINKISHADPAKSRSGKITSALPSRINWLFPQQGGDATFSRQLMIVAALIIASLTSLGIWSLTMKREATPEAVHNLPLPSTGASPTAPEASPTASAGQVLPQASSTPARVLLSIKDGKSWVTFYSNGQISGLDRLPDEHQRLIANALKNSRIETPAGLSALRGRSSNLMGSGPAERFNLIEPVGKIIFGTRPTLRWQALAGAESYTVTLVDSTGNEAKSPPLTNTTWPVERALTRGLIYTWQVVATKNGKRIIAPPLETPQAKFKVLDQSRADEMTRAQREYADQHLILGLLYARAGLIEDARRELNALSAANPQSKEVKTLLNKLPVDSRNR